MSSSEAAAVAAEEEPDRGRLRRDAAVEVAVAAAVLLACAWLGDVTGWKGPPKVDISTRIWPFYLDTWFPVSVWTGRAGSCTSITYTPGPSAPWSGTLCGQSRVESQ